MEWIVTIAVLLVAVGPVLYVIPSKRDKQLAALRSHARASGLTVDISHIPNLDAHGSDRVSAGGVRRNAKIKCTTYTLVLPKPLPEAPGWHLARSNKDNVLIPGWGRIGEIRRVSISNRSYWKAVGTIIEALPGACVAVRTTPDSVSWQGLEHLNGRPMDEVVMEVRDGLEKLSELHGQLDKERQLPRADT